MDKTSRTALLAAAGLALAACTSSREVEKARPDFEQLRAEAQALALKAEDLAFTDPTTLPTEGSASFDGVMEIGPTEDEPDRLPEMAGELAMAVDFGSDSVTGRADSFVTSAGEELAGSLEIDGGRIERDIDVDVDYTFEATLAGTLRGAEDREYAFIGGVLGDFFGTDHGLMGGPLAGTALTPDGAAAFSGSFVAED